MCHNKIIIDFLKKKKEKLLRERNKLDILLKKDNMDLRQKASIEFQKDFVDRCLRSLNNRIQLYRQKDEESKTDENEETGD